MWYRDLWVERYGRGLAGVAALAVLTACGGGDREPAVPADAPAAGGQAEAPAGAQQAAGGQAEYAVCATCHQQNGQGIAGTYPPLTGSEYVTGDPQRQIAIILHGLQGPITVEGQQYNSLMPGWGAQLSDEQIAAIATYERSSWGNSASAVTADQVAKVRSATSGRTEPWTVETLESEL